MIEITLSPEQVRVRHAAHIFAFTYPKDARAACESLSRVHCLWEVALSNTRNSSSRS